MLSFEKQGIFDEVGVFNHEVSYILKCYDRRKTVLFHIFINLVLGIAKMNIKVDKMSSFQNLSPGLLQAVVNISDRHKWR